MPARRRGHTPTVGLQTQVREDLLDHRLLEDRRDDLQLAAAVRAVRHVDLEHALEQLGPAQPHWAVVRARRLAFGGRCGQRGWFGRLGLWRHHLRAQLGVGCENAVLAKRGSAHFAQRSYANTKAEVVTSDGLKPRAAPQSPFVPPTCGCPLLRGHLREPKCLCDRPLRGRRVQGSICRCGSKAALRFVRKRSLAANAGGLASGAESPGGQGRIGAGMSGFQSHQGLCCAP